MTRMPFKKAAHRKVRTGCTICKKRRVKCDETKPGCRNCQRHGLKCSYTGHAPAMRACTEEEPDASPFSFVDFKLLQHWKQTTGESLAPNSSLQQAMREVIPLLAIHHEYLMHALLALTALHIAYLRPAESAKYELLAIHHQNLAFPLYRSALASVTEENCHALYACGHLVTKCAFASPQLREHLVFPSSLGSAADFISLLRGSFSIHDYAYQWLARGPLGFCLEKPLDPDPAFNLNPNDHHLARFLSFMMAEDSQEIHICCSALNSLRQILAMAATPKQTISTKTLTFSWPMQVPPQYLMLVDQKRPEALVVLAHYCVMLKMVDNFWFLQGSAVRILQQCYENLDERWHPHIEWQMSVVGLDQEQAQTE